MRSFTYALALAALVGPLGCAHPLAPVSAIASKAGAPHAAAAGGLDQAKAIVTQKFTEAGTQVVLVDASPTATPLVYAFTCSYRRTEFGQMCMYSATGEVDTQSGMISSKRKLVSCLGLAKP
jgi:hypothetical protein